MAFDWEPYKGVLRSLYLDQDKKLRDVISFMGSHHGVKKSRHQYESIFKRWGFRKNTSAESWKVVLRKSESRRKRGKETAIYRTGRLVPSKTLHLSPLTATAPTPKTPEGFHVCTPASSEPPTIMMDNLPTVHLYKHLVEWGHLFRAMTPEHKIRSNDEIYDDSYGETADIYGLNIGGVCHLDHSPSRPEELLDDVISGVELPQVVLSICERATRQGLVVADSFEASWFTRLFCSVAVSLLNNDTDDHKVQTAIRPLLKYGGKEFFESLITLPLPIRRALTGAALATAVRENELETVELIMERGRDPSMPADKLHRRLLEIAVDQGTDEMIALLLRYGADPNLLPVIEWELPPLISAAAKARPDAVKLLLRFGASVNVHQISNGQPVDSALHAAIRSGNHVITNLLLEAGADVEFRGIDKSAETVLQEASRNGDLHIVQQLLAYGADVNVNHSNTHTSLEIAAALGHAEIAGILIDHGARLSVDRELPKAAYNGHINVVHVILEHGANVNALPPDDYPYTALFSAAHNGHTPIVDLLVHLGANINALSGGGLGFTALQAAARQGHVDIVSLLLEHGADVNSPSSVCTALQGAARSGHADIVCLLIERGADVNAPPCGPTGYTALQAAASIQHFGIVNLLLEHGANCNASPGDELGTALQAAVSSPGKKSTRLARLLIEDWGAEVNAWSFPDRRGTALTQAVKDKNVSATRLLLTHGADVNPDVCQQGRGKTALQEALRGWYDGLLDDDNRYSMRITQLLLDAGASVDSLQPSDLAKWCQYGKVDMIRFLLDQGLDVNLRERYPDPSQSQDYQSQNEDCLAPTLLHLAASHGESDIVQLLCDRGAEVNAPVPTPWGGTALQAAIDSGDMLSVSMLLDYGADINAGPAPDGGTTALQVAALTGDIQPVTLLLEKGADVNAEPARDGGITALQAAATVGSIELVALLLENGADVNAPAAELNGRTALEAAAEHGRLDAVQLLLNVGAEVGGTRAIELALAEGHDGIVALLEGQ